MFSFYVAYLSRAPHGARGLKLNAAGRLIGESESRPTRGAWIETFMIARQHKKRTRRAPHGARGLKQCERGGFITAEVAPHTGRVD